MFCVSGKQEAEKNQLRGDLGSTGSAEDLQRDEVFLDPPNRSATDSSNRSGTDPPSTTTSDREFLELPSPVDRLHDYVFSTPVESDSDSEEFRSISQVQSRPVEPNLSSSAPIFELDSPKIDDSASLRDGARSEPEPLKKETENTSLEELSVCGACDQNSTKQSLPSVAPPDPSRTIESPPQSLNLSQQSCSSTTSQNSPTTNIPRAKQLLAKSAEIEKLLSESQVGRISSMVFRATSQPRTFENFYLSCQWLLQVKKQQYKWYYDNFR